MTIEKVRDFFGIKYLIPYNLTTFVPLVILRAVGEVTYENSVSTIDLIGGDTDAPYDVEFGQPSPTMKGKVSEYPIELFQLLEKTTVTTVSAEATGSVVSPTNGQGTSVFNSPGITNVTTHPSLLANLPFGRVTFIATGAQTLTAYLSGIGVVGQSDFQDMQGTVVTGISTTTTGSVQISQLGLVLTVTGIPNYTIGDTFYVGIHPVNTGYKKVVVGGNSVSSPPNFGVRCVFPRKSDGVLHYIDVYNVAGRGIGWQGVSRKWAELDISWKPLARSSDGAVYEMVRILGS